jgi:hypothetical protein
LPVPPVAQAARSTVAAKALNLTEFFMFLLSVRWLTSEKSTPYNVCGAVYRPTPTDSKASPTLSRAENHGSPKQIIARQKTRK